ncbi:MAG TPA: M20 family metallopeptidase [Candidatus Deferrimicrobium sp.]|nr:M20 family metallopeptidase [Candidatus Deferrimicrobium sp.]
MNHRNTSPEFILKQARRWHWRQVAWRRHFHQYPELSNRETKTTAFLQKLVSGLGLKVLPIDMKTGLLAELKGKENGPTVAVRTDIDALPITEQTGVPFKSKRPGCMHACGHDVHMAVVLGVAAILVETHSAIGGRGTVRFIFQPAEESPPGGARPMILSGAIDDVSVIFGVHVDPQTSTGKIGLRDGVTMASVTDFDLIVGGKGGHAARPHLGVDAISVAAEIVESVQKVVSREIDPTSPVAVSFGMVYGGTARNVIADRVTLQGTARALSPDAARALPKLIRRTAEGICSARGARLEMTIVADYPVLKNDPAVNRVLSRSFESLFGKGRVVETSPVLGGEDFACYLQKVPGAMFRLGVMNKELKADKPWHSPEFMVDEEAIFHGTATLVAAVLDSLGSRGQ